MSRATRSRWTCRRASSPVIHFDSPEGSAILPSIDSASLSVIRGRPSSSRVSQPASELAAACGPIPIFTSIPAARSVVNSLPRCPLVGVFQRDHDTRRLRLRSAGRCRRGRAGFHARRARASHRPSLRSRSFAGLGERDRLRVGPAAGRGGAAPDHLAGRGNDDAADIGVGRGLPARGFAKREGLGHEASGR